MHFTTGTYFVFLIAIFFAYWALACRLRWRVTFLAGVSCLFYAATGGRAVLLLVLVSLVDFTTANLDESS